MTVSTNWKITDRHIEPHTNRVSRLGFRLTYQDRECELDILLSTPIAGGIPEPTAALAEFQRLHEALGRILAERTL